MDIFHYAGHYALVLLIVLVTLFVVRGMLRGVRGARFALSVWAYLFGAFLVSGLAFHNAKILYRIIPGVPIAAGGVRPEYDFRFYSLLLVGVLLIWQGAKIMRAAGALARGGDETAAAPLLLLRSTLIVLGLCVPLVPLQTFALVITILGGINLAGVAIFRRGAVFRGESAISPLAAPSPRLTPRVNE